MSETQSSPPTLALGMFRLFVVLFFASCPTVSYYTVVWEGGHI